MAEKLKMLKAYRENKGRLSKACEAGPKWGRRDSGGSCGYCIEDMKS